jgi:hypothetical protein
MTTRAKSGRMKYLGLSLVIFRLRRLGVFLDCRLRWIRP